jgi:hypothetical protein
MKATKPRPLTPQTVRDKRQTLGPLIAQPAPVTTDPVARAGVGRVSLPSTGAPTATKAIEPEVQRRDALALPGSVQKWARELSSVMSRQDLFRLRCACYAKSKSDRLAEDARRVWRDRGAALERLC